MCHASKRAAALGHDTNQNHNAIYCLSAMAATEREAEASLTTTPSADAALEPPPTSAAADNEEPCPAAQQNAPKEKKPTTKDRRAGWIQRHEDQKKTPSRILVARLLLLSAAVVAALHNHKQSRTVSHPLYDSHHQPRKHQSQKPHLCRPRRRPLYRPRLKTQVHHPQQKSYQAQDRRLPSTRLLRPKSQICKQSATSWSSSSKRYATRTRHCKTRACSREKRRKHTSMP